MTKKRNLPAWEPELSPEAVEFTQPEVMVKFVAAISPSGYPHISLITCNEAIAPDTIKWGAFTEGRVKKYVREDPRQGILYMSAEMPFRFLQVKADFTHVSHEGADAEKFNQGMLLRYNTYLSVHTVYFNEVKAARPVRPLGLGGLVKGIVTPKGLKKFKTGTPEDRLPALAREMLGGPIVPKFLSYLDPGDGYPVVFPCFQARQVEGKTIVIPTTQFKEDLFEIPEGSKVAITAMDFDTRSIQAKGTLRWVEGRGVVDVEEVHHGMPPLAGQIYPKLDVREKVTNFTL
ncbi:MAG: hypothetical protein ACTSU5_08895 [Promethearchaeota archaeon]